MIHIFQWLKRVCQFLFDVDIIFIYEVVISMVSVWKHFIYIFAEIFFIKVY